ncbi:DMT family transporter [Uliginosibacterium sp. sgz301328]|uniref:DMT family transporter n=1 Tax=Uliginosibacterium sp. sgz301328 TaxID=3243764 RepID=UPI00359D8A0E
MRGVMLCVTALLMFACLDSITKHLVAVYPAALVGWMRYALHLLMMSALFAPRMGRALFTMRRPALVLIRGACLAPVTLFMALAFRHMPQAEATAVLFVSPFLVVLLARPILGERIGAVRWIAVAAGFGGMLLVVRPGAQLDWLGVGLVLAGAVCYAFYLLLSRVLSASDGTINMLFYTALLGTFILGLFLPWSWSGPKPTALDVAFFVGIGLLGFVGHWLFTLAFRDAPASLLAPISYAQLGWATLLGWLVFGQLPDHVGMLGIAIIMASGVAVALYGSRGRA